MHLHGEGGRCTRFPDFKPVEISDAGLVRSFEPWIPSGVSEFSFANLIVWRDFDRPSLTLIDGSLCIKISPPNEPAFFLEPLGDDATGRAMDACVDHAGKISRVGHAFALRARARGLTARPIRNYFDYIYRAADLAELKGRRYDGKRNHIRRLVRSFPDYEYVPLMGGMCGQALALFDLWRDSQRGIISGAARATDLAYSCQRRAIERAFESFDELGLAGGALMIGGECAGFIIGSRFKDDEACIHLCYARPDVRGSFQTILWEACRRTFSRFTYVNLEQDLGLDGIRRFKRSYHPIRVQEKFECERSY